MNSLFEHHSHVAPRYAVFSPCGKYRYQLQRIWNPEAPLVAYIGLNPSTPNSEKDDQTIRRLIAISKKLNFGGFLMLNLFAIVSSKPAVLLTCEDPQLDNNIYLRRALATIPNIVFCWGTFKEARARAAEIAALCPVAFCFGHNADGSPKHPCYLPNTSTLQPFNQ